MTLTERDQATGPARVLTNEVAGRLAAVLYLLCGVVTAASPLLPAPAGMEGWPVVWIGVAATAIGAAAWYAPWAKVSRPGMLWILAPPAMTLISLHNLYGGVDPYRYAIFYMVLFVWVGVTQERWTALRVAPLAVASYLAPLFVGGHHPVWAYTSAVYAVPVFVLVAEAIAWVSARLARAQGELSRLAFSDPLTGLPNRAAFYRALEASWGRAVRRQADLAVLFVDLDGFKSVNDHFGHRFGDQVLVRVSDAIRQVSRAGDELARLGGDEFAVVAEDVGGPAGAAALAQRVVEAVRQPISHGDDQVFLSCSVGVAVGPEGVDLVDDLVRFSDLAMYRAKRAGGDRAESHLAAPVELPSHS